jgi:hypothetical protein
MFGIPYNAISWMIGFLAVYTFAYRSYLAYKKTGNEIAKIYCGMSLAFGIGFLFYGVLTPFTTDLTILLKSYLFSEAAVQVGVQFQVWLLWFIGLRNMIRLRYLLCISLTFSILILIVEVLTSKVFLSQSPLLFITKDIPLALGLKCLVYIATSWPLGYFFIRQSGLQQNLKAQLTSIATGLIFIVVSGATVLKSIIAVGSDSYDSAVINAVVFLIFLALNLLPRRLSLYEYRTVTTNT